MQSERPTGYHGLDVLLKQTLSIPAESVSDLCDRRDQGDHQRPTQPTLHVSMSDRYGHDVLLKQIQPKLMAFESLMEVGIPNLYRQRARSVFANLERL